MYHDLSHNWLIKERMTKCQKWAQKSGLNNYNVQNLQIADPTLAGISAMELGTVLNQLCILPGNAAR